MAGTQHIFNKQGQLAAANKSCTGSCFFFFFKQRNQKLIHWNKNIKKQTNFPKQVLKVNPQSPRGQKHPALDQNTRNPPLCLSPSLSASMSLYQSVFLVVPELRWDIPCVSDICRDEDITTPPSHPVIPPPSPYTQTLASEGGVQSLQQEASTQLRMLTDGPTRPEVNNLPGFTLCHGWMGPKLCWQHGHKSQLVMALETIHPSRAVISASLTFPVAKKARGPWSSPSLPLPNRAGNLAEEITWC